MHLRKYELALLSGKRHICLSIYNSLHRQTIEKAKGEVPVILSYSIREKTLHFSSQK